MPSMSAYRRKLSGTYGNQSLGDIVKAQSDMVMEATWDNDVATRDCYLYSYWNDDTLEICQGMTYEHTAKTKIRAKFIAVSDQTISKDLIEYNLMFKPSMSRRITDDSEFAYYKHEFVDKYSATFPNGLENSPLWWKHHKQTP